MDLLFKSLVDISSENGKIHEFFEFTTDVLFDPEKKFFLILKSTTMITR